MDKNNIASTPSVVSSAPLLPTPIFTPSYELKGRPTEVNRQADVLKEDVLYGFDYLRAIMSLAVVVIHMRFFPRTMSFGNNGLHGYIATVSDILNFQFLFLAVPTFLLMSLYLLSIKINGKGFGYFVKRSEKIIYMYLLWSGIYFIATTQNPAEVLKELSGVKDILIFIASGGNSIFYFFFTLLCLSCAVYLSARLQSGIIWILLAISLSLLWIIPYLIMEHNAYRFLAAYWNPLNFAPCVFIAILAARYFKPENIEENLSNIRGPVIWLTVLFIALSFLEWKWIPNANSIYIFDNVMPAYTRISVNLGAALMLLASFFIRSPTPGWIKFLSDYSLGLYCLHLFVITILENFIQVDSFSFMLLNFTLVLVISYLGAFIIRRALKVGLI